MIPKNKLDEIKDFLINSQNPLFFFDEDPDGLCSYILLKKLTERGKGVIIKGKPILESMYLRKVKEYSPDFIFVLDKPMIEQDFLDGVSVPLIWLDHHPLQENKGARYYNPLQYQKDDIRPTSFWAYEITKTSLMFAVIGCVSDYYIPPYTKEFSDLYPDVLPKKLSKPDEILYTSRLGELIKIIAFSLKGNTSDVAKLINILFKIEDPYEILDGTTPRGKFVLRHAQKILKEYNSIKESAVETFKEQKENVLVYVYSNKKNSLTKELSSELRYIFGDKIVILGRQKDDEIKLSIRSSTIPVNILVKKALEGVSGYGGGHPYACGANVQSSDFKKFVEQFKTALKTQNL